MSTSSGMLVAANNDFPSVLSSPMAAVATSNNQVTPVDLAVTPTHQLGSGQTAPGRLLSAVSMPAGLEATDQSPSLERFRSQESSSQRVCRSSDAGSMVGGRTANSRHSHRPNWSGFTSSRGSTRPTSHQNTLKPTGPMDSNPVPELLSPAALTLTTSGRSDESRCLSVSANGQPQHQHQHQHQHQPQHQHPCLILPQPEPHQPRRQPRQQHNHVQLCHQEVQDRQINTPCLLSGPPQMTSSDLPIGLVDLCATEQTKTMEYPHSFHPSSLPPSSLSLSNAADIPPSQQLQNIQVNVLLHM